MEFAVQRFVDDMTELGLDPRVEAELVICRVTPIDGARAGTPVETGVSLDELGSWPQVPAHWVVLMLLSMSSGLGARQAAVKLAGDVALERADDLAFGAALGGAALDVGAGAGVVDHAHHDDAPERVVCAAVATAVESLAGGQSRRSVDRGDAAEWAKAASLRRRPGLSPAETSSALAVSVPTP